MSRFYYGQEEVFIGWAEERIPHCRFRSDAHAIAHVRDRQILGVFVYDHFTPRSCFMHFASDGSKRWLTRDFLRHAFAIPFIQWGYARVTGPISELNTASRNIALKLGCVEEGRMREEGPEGEDLIIYGLLARECRFLPRTGTEASSAVKGTSPAHDVQGPTREPAS